MSNDERGFKVIEEIHTLPSITYLTKVRNTTDKEQLKAVNLMSDNEIKVPGQEAHHHADSHENHVEEHH
jgi:hypothetical protein